LSTLPNWYLVCTHADHVLNQLTKERVISMKYLRKKERVLCCLLALSMTTFATGCATDISSKSYSDEDVGEAAQTYSGTVVKVRSVKVAPDQLGKSHVGMLAGGMGGGLIGSQIASGLGGAIATLGLAGAGALGGAMAEKSLKTQQGLEITVRLNSGELRTVVQGNDVSFKQGERIYLMIYSRGRCKVVKESEPTQDKEA